MTLVPEKFFDAVAVLEDGQEESTISPVATGTILGFAVSDQSDVPEGQTRYNLFLVTNRHVVEGGSDGLWIRFNQGVGSKRFWLDMKKPNGDDCFVLGDPFDVAVCVLNGGALSEGGAEYGVIPDNGFLDLDAMEKQQVGGGDDVFVLGFPMGLAGTERKYAIARSGAIARVDREIVSETGSYLIDCTVFPGNSGGPVLLRPEPVALQGRKPRNKVHLIGIVSGYVPYSDVATSQQTGRPRVTFEENSGLATVVPLDAVIDLVDELKALSGTATDTVTDPK